MKNLSILLILNILLFVNIHSQTNEYSEPQQYINRSHKLQNESMLAEATAILTEGIAKFPDESLLYFERAEFYHQVKKFDLMEKDAYEAVRLSNDKYNAYVNAGVMFSYVKMCDKALVLYTNAINLKPDDSMAFINRAVLHGYCFKDKSQALNDIDYALSIDPDDSYAKSFRNTLIAEIANQKPSLEIDLELLKTLEQKLANSPNDERLKRELTMLYLTRSSLFEKEKKIKEMFADIDRAVAINNDADILRMRGRKLCEYKYFEDAIKDFNEVLKQQPEFWLIYIYRGDAYHNLNQFQKAIESYKQALTIDLASEKLINSRIKRTKQKMRNHRPTIKFPVLP